MSHGWPEWFLKIFPNTQPNMTRSNESIINEVFKKYTGNLADFGRPSCSRRESRQGFAKFSKMFCDSLVMWGLYNTLSEETKGVTIGKYMAELRELCSRHSLPCDSIKMVTTGTNIGEEYFSEDMKQAYAAEFAGQSLHMGYIAIKMSLKQCRAKRAVLALSPMLETLRSKHMVLHDIDMTRDCRYVTERRLVEQHLLRNGITTVIKDRSRVGDHCISWMGSSDDTKNIRYKVYNKFVQILESAEVRKSLGSRMEGLVADDDKRFMARLLRHKDHGMSRLELTFYGSTLLSLDEYLAQLADARTLLSTCPVYDHSYEEMWKERANYIESMVAVHIPAKKVFAYCHWWNSVTSKKYGYMWKNVGSKLVPLLLANYSFNDRPIHCIKVKVDDAGKVEIISEKVYERESGCTAMTLVAGKTKGMFPSRDTCEGLVYEFSEVGIVEHKNISIGWPEKKHSKKSRPLAVLVEKPTSDSHEGYVRWMKKPHSTLFTADYNILVPGTEYTVVAAGLADFRGNSYWHLVTECGLKVKAGKSLEGIWERWRGQYTGDHGRVLIHQIPKMRFLAERKVRIRGVFDMKCVLVRT